MARFKLKAGSTSRTVGLFIQDSTGAGLGSLVYNSASLAARYKREGQSSWTTISLVTMTVGTWTSGGFVANGGQTGSYDFGVPNAVLASGALSATIEVYGATGMLLCLLDFELDAIDYQDGVRAGLSGLPNVAQGNAGALITSGSGTGQLDVTGGVAKANVLQFLGTLLTETVAGYLTAGFKKFFDVEVPVHTVASVNQTGDSYGIVNHGSHGNAALLTGITNIQNGTFVSTTIPGVLEKPDSGSVNVTVVVIFADEQGAAKDIDGGGNPTLVLVNDAGTSLAGRLSGWSHPATGKYTIDYTNAAAHAIEGAHWEITGTINTKLRRYVAYMQIVDTTAVDFTSTDRTNLALAVSQTTGAAIRADLGLANANLDTQFGAIPTATQNRQEMDSSSTKLNAVYNKLPANNLADQTLLTTSVANLQVALEAVIAAVQESVDEVPTSAEVATELMDKPNTIDAQTLRGYCRIMLAGMVGKVSDAEINRPKFRSSNDTKVRISATTDTHGNRSLVNIDGS